MSCPVFVVQVEAVAATTARTGELGGEVVVAPVTLEDAIVIAYLTDPNGSTFARSARGRRAELGRAELGGARSRG